jgi:hypothetical protein
VIITLDDWRTKLEARIREHESQVATLPQYQRFLRVDCRLTYEIDSLCELDVDALMQCAKCPLGSAQPPTGSGVYVLYDHEDLLAYVGLAKGSKGLWDRLTKKHISGDESHAAQRAYMDRFPDRAARRAFIKEHVKARWTQINDAARATELEPFLRWIFRPPWDGLFPEDQHALGVLPITLTPKTPSPPSTLAPRP